MKSTQDELRVSKKELAYLLLECTIRKGDYL